MTKKIDNTRLIILALGAVLAVFALIGSIGLLAVSGSGMEIDTRDIEDLGKVTSIFVFHDFARFGAFGIFALAVVHFILDYTSEKRVNKLSLISVVCSLFGFVAVFMVSVKSLFDALLSSYMSAMSSSLYGYGSSSSAPDPLGGVKALAVVSVIFIMLSAAAALTLFIAALVIRFKPQGYANPYGYGYPNQQYPQQFPQQGVPMQPAQPMQPVQPMQPAQQMQPTQPVQQPVYTAPAPMPVPTPTPAPVQEAMPAPAPAPSQSVPLSQWNCSCGTVNSAEAKFCFVCGKPRQ